MSAYFGLSQKSKLRKVLYRGFQLLILGIVFYYIWINISRSGAELRSYQFSISWKYIFVSFIFLGTYYLNASLIWFILTAESFPQISPLQAIRAWLISIPGKYIPGKIAMPLGRAYFYRNISSHAVEMTVFFIIERITQAGGAFLLMVILLPFFHNVLKVPVYFFILITSLFILAFYPKIWRRIIKYAGQKKGKDKSIEFNFSYKKAVMLITLNTLNLLAMGGTGFFFFSSAFHPLPLKALPYLSFSLGTAGIAGFMFLFLPAGIGVREGVLIFLLDKILPAPFPVIISLSARIWTAICEVCLSGIAYLWHLFSTKKQLHKN